MLDNVEILNQFGESTGKYDNLDAIHSNGLWHKTSHIWLFDDNGKILLQKRSLNSTYSNLYDISCAGHIPKDYDELETAKKELKEELGLTIEDKQLKKICTLKTSKIIPELNKKDNEFNTIYLCKCNCLNDNFNIQKEELDSVESKYLKDFESDLTDPEKSKNYVDHGIEYYSKIICAIKKELKKN